MPKHTKRTGATGSRRENGFPKVKQQQKHRGPTIVIVSGIKVTRYSHEPEPNLWLDPGFKVIRRKKYKRFSLD